MQKIINVLRPTKVLDVGCNTGFYSIQAAKQGAQVVAIDSDRAVVGRLWSAAARDHLDILPLVVDLTRPTPGMGWRNSECASFIERATGHFDCCFHAGRNAPTCLFANGFRFRRFWIWRRN